MANQINQIKVNRVKEMCFLGVILDENLSEKAHIGHIARKISKTISIIVGQFSMYLNQLCESYTLQ